MRRTLKFFIVLDDANFIMNIPDYGLTVKNLSAVAFVIRI
jgi:hypothetical protein